ncbi:LysR family transcriptional regulator [Dactylosporangium aurantiacum]|uniref:LysR family transcriptional regulator n=1 Tax=Dactylosporangium aurantiacum TaxID=35754 RepID=A0A9Q9MEH6_9ACTN|nr:LysR family transcriptional regulator [Dactylosporangium aurantiacum]MDG6107149.1 LysR family transcriptional regulator [Dactylosporangium aurantiacum]UWZ51445.1 LysR family transcriptional regulator [Dactylosporangium aurantiacum]
MDRRGVSPEALAAFVVFADHLNFTRAAAQLRISQPALHVKIGKLAQALGRPLYHRTGRRLVLTADGEAVARFARAHDERLAQFLTEFAGAVPQRPVVLAAGQGAYLYLLGDTIRAVLTDEPTRLRLVNCDHRQMLAAVRTGQAHLGVSVLDVLPEDLTAVAVATFPQMLFVPEGHRLDRPGPVALPELRGTRLVVPPQHRPHRVLLEQALRAEGVDWTVAVEAEGWPLIAQFVALGVGLAVVNGCVPAPAGVRARPVAGLPPVTYHLVHQPSALADPRVAGLVERILARD